MVVLPPATMLLAGDVVTVKFARLVPSIVVPEIVSTLVPLLRMVNDLVSVAPLATLP